MSAKFPRGGGGGGGKPILSHPSNIRKMALLYKAKQQQKHVMKIENKNITKDLTKAVTTTIYTMF